MSPCKWSLCICLWGGWILAGLPLGVNSEVSSDETQPKTVKECRVHIEKALEEYWDKNEQGGVKSSNTILTSNYQKQKYDNKDENGCERERNRDDLPEDHLEEEIGTTDTDDKVDEQVDSAHELSDHKEVVQNVDQDKNQNSDSTKNDVTDRIPQRDNYIEENKTELLQDALPNKDDSKLSNSEKNDIKRLYVVKNLNKEPIEIDDFNSDEGEAGVENDKEEQDSGIDSTDDDDDEEDDDEVDTKDEGGHDVDDDSTDDDGEIEYDTQDDEDDEEQEDEDDGTEHNVDDAEKESEPISEEKKVPTALPTNETLESNIYPDEQQINGSKVSEEKELPTPETEPSIVNVSIPEPSHLETVSPEVPKKSQSEIPEIQKTPQLEIPEVSKKSHSETPEVLLKNESEPELATREELIENIYEEDEEEEDSMLGLTYRNRDHIDVILGLDEVGTELEKEEEKLAQSIFNQIKKIEMTNIKPMELLYKFADSTTRSLGDAEIFSKPLILFLGPWNAGKTSIINYILGIERTPSALATGTGITDVDFTVLTYGPQRRVISGTELAADWRYSGVQKFGQGFLDHFRSIHIPHALLQKVTIIDTPGILENRKTTERGYSLNDAFQWFIDRADAIYVVLDPNKVDIGGELGSVIDQLKGRDVRFILNKADSIRRSDLMRVVGQLFWNLSPLMSSSEAPIIYAVSLTTHPFHPSAPARFLDDQEKNLFYDMRSTLEKRVENRILYARKHAVWVRNHAKMVDCYLATFYRHKSIFSNKRNVAKLIIENPRDYSIYDGLSSMTNVSRYDLPNPITYKGFFQTHALYDFKPLASTCSYFRGCPMDKLDLAIAKEIPELLAKYKKAKTVTQEVPQR